MTTALGVEQMVEDDVYVNRCLDCGQLFLHESKMALRCDTCRKTLQPPAPPRGDGKEMGK